MGPIPRRNATDALLAAPAVAASFLWLGVLWKPWIASGVGPMESRLHLSDLWPPVFALIVLLGLILVVSAIWESLHFETSNLELTVRIASVLLVAQVLYLVVFEVALGMFPNEFLPEIFGKAFSVRGDTGMWASLGLLGVVVVWPRVRVAGWAISGDGISSSARQPRVTQMLLAVGILFAAVGSLVLRYSSWIRLSVGESYVDWTGADWPVVGQMSLGAILGCLALLFAGLLSQQRWRMGLVGAVSFAAALLATSCSIGARRLLDAAAQAIRSADIVREALQKLVEQAEPLLSQAGVENVSARRLLESNQVSLESAWAVHWTAALCIMGMWASLAIVAVDTRREDIPRVAWVWAIKRCGAGMVLTALLWWGLVL